MHTILLFVGITQLLLCGIGAQVHDENRRICGYRRNQPVCCSGWYNGINNPCSIPACAGNCGDRGRCVKPHTCQCADGRLRFTCDSNENEEMQYDQQAVGYCPMNCNNNGKCRAGKCECDPGYSGSECQDMQTGPCFATLNRGLCINAIRQHSTAGRNETLNMTREMCCNALGVAWGFPCELCQSTTHCGRGYQKNNGRCLDINECNIPGVCQGGRCINQEGFYTCNCPTGYVYKEDTLECAPEQNACERNPHSCSPGGKCVPLWNSDYRCTCKWGYMLSEDQKSCVPRHSWSFNICELYKSSICKNGECISRGNTYECRCNEGYALSDDRKTCQRLIDYCSLHRGQLCKNGQCITHGQDYYCKCDSGYFQSQDRRSCLHRCEYHGSSVCLNGYCVMLPNGEYECQCRSGYEVSVDKKRCIAKQASHYSPTHDRVGISYNDHYQPVPLRHGSLDNVGWWSQHDLQGDIPSVERIGSKRIHAGWSAATYYQQPGRSTLNRGGAPCSQAEVLLACSGGFCLNLGGEAYRCECYADYVTSADGRRCIQVADATT